MKSKFCRIILILLCIASESNSFAQNAQDTCKYYFPNTLTPDSEPFGSEILEIGSNCTFKSFDFSLFDRWGELIFHSTDPEMKFDSTGLRDGTYAWKLKAEFCNTQTIDDTDYINVIR